MASGNERPFSQRVLIYAPFGRDGALIQKELSNAEIEAKACGTFEELVEGVSEGAAAALIGDEALRPAAVDSLASVLAEQPPWSDFPVLVMTSGGEATDASRYRLHLLGPLGNVTLFERPVRPVTLISGVRAALRARRHQYDLARHLAEREEAELALRRSQGYLQSANLKLMRANADLEQFAYSASHDLQEPLRNVGIYSQMLRKRYHGMLDAQADEYIGFVVEGSERMSLLLRDLLAYVNASEGEPSGAAVVDATQVARQCLLGLGASIEESQAKVQIGDLPRVRVQETHLRQVFQNLLGNAIKYRRKIQTPQVDVYSASNGKFHRISVRDNGIGIDPKYHARIFGVFKRLHSRHEYTGNGIGLAICQRIVERYGGRIWVESEPGAGSTFHFTVPMIES